MDDDDHMECDRCGATIVYDHFERPSPFNFAFDVSDKDDPDPTFEQETRVLCSGCVDDLITWIDEGDIDRSDCVDLPRAVTAATALEQISDRIADLAETLRTDIHHDRR